LLETLPTEQLIVETLHVMYKPGKALMLHSVCALIVLGRRKLQTIALTGKRASLRRQTAQALPKRGTTLS